MAARDRVSAVTPDDLVEGAPTPGIVRELAFETEHATLIRSRAEARAVTGWHHHGKRDVLGYVVSGAARFEFGPGGAEGTDVVEGGFFFVPAGLVHRDVNPLDQLQELVLSVVGEGPLVINVDGPPPA